MIESNPNKSTFGTFFLRLQRVIRWVYPRYTVNTKNFPDFEQPIVLVARHSNLKGPFRILVWTNRFVRTWVLSEFVDREDTYNHYVNYTFTQRFGMPKGLAKFLARPASRFVGKLTSSLGAIPVYRKSRKIIETFRQSVESLSQRHPILIFPDVNYSTDDGPVQALYEGFLTIEKLYYQKYKEHVSFIPVYADPDAREIRFAESIRFTDGSDFRATRGEIANQIQHSLNNLKNISK